MANGIFVGDPLSGNGYAQFENGDIRTTTVYEFTGGLYSVINGQLVSTTNSFNRITLGRQGDFSLEQFENNRYNVISQTLQGTVNRTVDSDSIRLASGSVTIMKPSGGEVTVNIEQTAISRVGYQWAVYTTDDGSERMTRVPAKYRTNAQLQSDYTGKYRLATAREVVLNAFAWASLHELADVIREEYKGILSEDQLAADDYELVQGVLLQYGSLSNVKIFQSTLFEE